ncbi:MAG: homocitrate synthase [Anaerolineae bacterium]|nr:homocitrate synthase [Anaerolineae bacterium]
MSLEHFSIVDTTLREGEQFVNANFNTEQKIAIAHKLDAFGVEYIEVTSPCASPQSFEDCCAIAGLGLRAKVLTHVRCHLSDAQRAVETGVDGVNVMIGTSTYLQKFSHGKSIDAIVDLAQEVVTFLQSQNVEVRFSAEDSMRSSLPDLFKVYEAVDALGINRVGVADTVGIGTPHGVYGLIKELRSRVKADIEFHGHNDTGCAIANAYAALEAGGTHIDTTVLGIGERNGITSLGGLIARMYATDPNSVARYNLAQIAGLDSFVASLVNIDIPFNNILTGFSAFNHKAGLHTNAVLKNPTAYEALNPEDFGLTRNIQIAHRLTGWNAISHRARELGLFLDDQQIKLVTEQVKTLSDGQQLSLDDVDQLLRGTQQLQTAGEGMAWARH